ncbi:MAG: zeta toxin family protein [Pseudomonadota bacterium]
MKKKKSKDSKQVIILAGPNGSGKTTLSKDLLPDKKLPFLNADEIAKDMNPNDVAAVRISAGKKFLNAIQNYIKKNKSFALESTLSGQYLVKIIEQLKKKKYAVHIIYIFLENTESAISRVKVRVKKGGHHVPDEDVIRRFYRSKEKFWNIYRPIVDSWEILYNGEDDLSIVATGAAKLINIIDENKFNVFQRDITNER